MLLDLDYQPVQGQVALAGAYQTQPPLPPLNRWVQSYWQLNVAKGQFWYHSVPDNCVDWIINLDYFEDNFLIPPFLSAALFRLEGPACFFGIRFRILGHHGLMTTPLGEWGQASDVRAQDLLAKVLVCSVFESIEQASFDTRCAQLSAVLLSAIKLTKVDPRLANYIRYCHANVGANLDLSDKQCAEFGVSARQLRRLTQQHLGLLPKDFARVLRFQRTLNAMNMQKHNTAYLDYYFDQSHFIREFKRLAGLTPTQFQKMSVLYNAPMAN
ncbi:AraC family transcriptional regulator [Motilimonas eburnea]|uniref:AraC family transcriptional regulator n=1 Tax=Motilimonas eburnea TaxID=1737488 RepID=UPI001E4702BC|nr:helix-turn-helix domain-containing protein [Motilimonas eburnea]MCE2571111.1 helix-turn-helix domain-containing protein [Motilimonas eburnea]